MNTAAVIMSGGVGSRFWPVSRKEKPKQFLPLSGGESLLRQTYERLTGVIATEGIYIATGMMYRDLVFDQLPLADPSRLLLEPEGKNTAPCIGYASAVIAKRQGGDTVCAYLPADHAISPADAFRRGLRQAMELADERQAVVTIGIRPDRPETGYGYLRAAERIPGGSGAPAYRVGSFVEKPAPERARSYLEEGGYYWNAGMFVSPVRIMLDALERHLPFVYEGVMTLAEAVDTDQEGAALEAFFSEVDAVSIDYGVMEKLSEVYLVEAEFEWSDLGSWESVYELSVKDGDGHAVRAGEVVSVDSRGCLVDAGRKTVALVGVDDLVVISSGEALLVCRKDRSQRVRAVVEELRERGRSELL